MFGQNRPPSSREDDNWRVQLNDFVKANQPEVAALAWGLWQEQQDKDIVLGIDIEPKPHFVCCPKSTIEALNRNVDDRLRSMMGVVDGHDPETEVLVLGIGRGEVQAIQFKPEPSPSECFERVGKDVDSLIEILESRMGERVHLS